VSRVAWVFPGQGSQVVGMGRDLYTGSSAARAVFDQADATLDFPLSRLCFEGPAEQLTATENAQPAILAVSAALLATAAESLGPREAGAGRTEHALLRPLLVAGHSLGEYSALLAAGVLDLTTALRLVRRRGELMAQADEGAMAAVIGLEAAQLEQVVAEAAEGQELVIANYNAPGQLVISGAAAAVERAGGLARKLGAKRVLPLNVSAAFHSPLMAPAARALSAMIAEAELHDAAMPVVGNVDARPLHTASDIRQELRAQMTAPVRWIETIRFMAEQGVDTFVEIGPGSVLSGLIKRIAPAARLINLKDLESVEASLCQP
jgi:[acyl-carrier-protein] S-malonyltransferase